MPIQIVPATEATQLRHAAELFFEYGRSLPFRLDFQRFDEELSTLPGKYAPPSGRILLGLVGENAAGCVALRPLDDATCEMKRLYVRPAYRGHGIGRQLAEQIIEDARAMGYRAMRLDTLPTILPAATSLYRDLGFVEIAPYCENPFPDALFLELKLDERRLAMND